MTQIHPKIEIYYSQGPALNQGILTQEEHTLYNRFLIEKRKQQFLHGRHLFKTWMARHFASPTSNDYSLHPTQDGEKPMPYYHGQALTEIDISLSHCKDIVVMAIGHHTRVGVDIESLRSSSMAEALYDFLCSPNEMNTKRDDDLAESVTKTWVTKEAVLKTNGLGFSENPHSIRIDWGTEEAYHRSNRFFFQLFRINDLYGCVASTARIPKVNLISLPLL